MSYSARMQKNHQYSVFLAPRGYPRLADQGAQIAQQYLSPFDLLIGVVGDAGAGKSMIIKGMFPGLELTNDDEGVNVRPLPLMEVDERSFYSAHTYHVDIRFEQAFYQLVDLADAIRHALDLGKRVVVEHFDLIYEQLGINAHLLIGLGEEIIVTRPNLFGPDPRDICAVVKKSIVYRRMAHTAEDLCEYCLMDKGFGRYGHSDVRHGFILSFEEKPDVSIRELEQEVKDMIRQSLPISYLDANHILIGDQRHCCTGPRMHVTNTSEIRDFSLHPNWLEDSYPQRWLLVGLVGIDENTEISDLNEFVSY